MPHRKSRAKEAIDELIEAAAWYELEVSDLGEQLIDAFEQLVVLLGEPRI